MVTSKQVTIQMVRKFAENVEIVKFSKIEGNHSTEKVRKYCNGSKIEHFDACAAGPSDSAWARPPLMVLLSFSYTADTS